MQYSQRSYQGSEINWAQIRTSAMISMDGVLMTCDPDLTKACCFSSLFPEHGRDLRCFRLHTH